MSKATEAPGSVALLAPDRRETTYAALAEHLRRTAVWFRDQGVGPADRVALVAEGGPDAATAFLAIAAAASCAPLNPSYRAAELEFYLRDLGPRAALISSRLDTPARDVARRLGIAVHELSVEPQMAAGVFVLGDSSRRELPPPEREAEALVLHTSGTTARPKIVPLTHGHLLASARNVSTTLDLRPTDRCLNVMPLFHIHGLVAALLASLRAGASVACAPGFHQLRFFELLNELSPTWTTAVPTMYQSLLERARRDPELLARHTLRFVRSSSASLPVSVLEGLEDAFRVPVIEAYGMTEAAHQMTSNPMPPQARRRGSVGLATGTEIAILDEAGSSLPSGAVGEVAVRGESVFAGYQSNPQANESAFVDGWFRTGDQGRLDSDGFLFLLGRLKEIINRAGEKISPLEVDEVLLRHPAVEQAVTFGVPHERLGEEVAAAVVPRAGAVLNARELQDFAAQVVAPFKVPRRILVVDEIPKGATGKVQRVALADRFDLGNMGTAAFDGERDDYLEQCFRVLWADVLGVPEVEALDDFFALGGDSILGAEAVARVRDLLGRPDVPLVAIVRSPTPRAMAAEVESEFGWDGDGVIAIGSGDESAPPLFFAHGVDGEIVRFGALAHLLGSGRRAFGLRPPGHELGANTLSDVETLSALYLDGMRAVQPEGPYAIVSYCMGAAIALELAHRLESEGATSRLVLIDPRLRRPAGVRYALWLIPRRLRQRRLLAALHRRVTRRRSVSDEHARDRGVVWTALETAREAYVSRPTTAPVALLSSDNFDTFEMPEWYLRAVFPRTVFRTSVPGEHMNLFHPREIADLHRAVVEALTRLEATQ